MRITTTAVVGMALAAFMGTTIGASQTRLTGRAAAVTATSLDVITQAEGTKTVHLDSATQYMKWITQKPFGQSQNLDASALGAGRCVQVDLRSADANQAKTVWVSQEPAGSIGDPCHTLRAGGK